MAKVDQLSKACTALLGEPLVAHSETVAKEMGDRYPAPKAEDVARMELLPASLTDISDPGICAILRDGRSERDRRGFARNAT